MSPMDEIRHRLDRLEREVFEATNAQLKEDEAADDAAESADAEGGDD